MGGGVVLDDQGVVVTQPAAGEFKGFSNICTHQGNKVSSVSNGVITCPFHGSQFDITTGDNVTGPNGEAAGTVPPLPAVAVKVSGNEVVRA